MIKDISIKRNLGLQTLYQILNTILPLITAPYLARVLGATQLGIFSFTSSIVSYFTLFAMLGTMNYGTRCIAYVREDRFQRSKIFLSIYLFQVFVTSISLIGYTFYISFFCKDNGLIFFIQGLAILSCFLDINWLFFGMEAFQITVARNIFIRISTVTAILIFVKNENDLWLYTVLMLGGTFVSQLVLWVYIRKLIDFVKIDSSTIVKHIKPNIVLFIPLLAMSVYHAMDKTMLGLLSSYHETGLYYNTDKLINIPLCILTGFGVVLLPRMTKLFNSGRIAEAKNLLILSLDGIAFLSIGMAFGISAIARDFIPLFFGKGYEECTTLSMMLSTVLLIKGISNSIRTQYLVPLNMERIFIQSVVAGAIINFLTNFLLIPNYGALGAVIGTVFAELLACVWQLIFIRKDLPLQQMAKSQIFYMLFGLIMFLIIQQISNINIAILLKLLLEIFCGGIFYIICTLTYWHFTQNKLFSLILNKR